MVRNDVGVFYVDGTDSITCPPLLIGSNNYVLFQWNDSVLCYNAETGEMIKELKAANSQVISIGLHPANRGVFVTCTLDGFIQMYNISDLYETQHFDIKQMIHTFELFQNVKDGLTALVTCSSEITPDIIEACLISLKEESISTKKLPFCFTERSYTIRIGYNFKTNYVAAALDNVVMVLENLQSECCRKHMVSANQLNNIVCHSKVPEFLTCDSLGRIFIWNNIFSNTPNKCYYHWHTLPVRTLSLTKDGTKILSGGSECVLVKTDHSNFKVKEFVTRLSAPICHLSLSEKGDYAAMVTDDNGVHIVDVETMHVTKEIRRLPRSSNSLRHLHFDIRTKALVFNSYVGHLVFYDPYRQSDLFDLDISNAPKVTSEQGRKAKNTEITTISFNRNCNWLATVEELCIDEQSRFVNQIFLKFWLFDSKDQNFELNSLVSSPHVDHGIHHVEFSDEDNDDNLLCATVGKNKLVNIWKIFERVSVTKKLYWMCIDSLSYRNFETSIASFSCNSCLLAVNFARHLTVWSMNTYKLKNAQLIPFTEPKSNIKFLKFGKASNYDLIIVANDLQLFVWDLLSLSPKWAVDVSVQYLFTDPLSKHFAIFNKNNTLIIFSYESENMVYEKQVICNKEFGIIAAAFVPRKSQINQSNSKVHWLEQSNIFYLSDKLYLIEDEAVRNKAENDSAIRISIKTNKKTPLVESLMRNINTLPTKLDIKSHQYNDQSRQQTVIEQFIQQPCYTIMSIDYYSETYLSSLLKKQANHDDRMDTS